jgi:hypothetical protein
MGYLCNDFFTCIRKDYDEKMWYCQTEEQSVKVCDGIVRRIHISKFEILMKEALLKEKDYGIKLP